MKLIPVTPLDSPIEFKEINPVDFPSYEVQGETKTIIPPDENGYISEQLLLSIDCDTQNTVVVNAGVGQGKSHATIALIKKLYEEKNEDGTNKYVIVIAAPFKTLIEQYCNKLIEANITAVDVFDYRAFEYGHFESAKVAHKLPVHVITIKSFIGDYGEIAIEQSEAKRSYLNSLLEYCENNEKQVVIFFDEIHDSISSFKEKFIFNLWKWEKVIHKIIALSATYNEASKLVIQYLAELTKDRIQIIESARTRFEAKQSDLFLALLNRSKYSADDKELVKIVKAQIDAGKKVDILCFSKTLAEQICQEDNDNRGIKKSILRGLLETQYDNINLCTGDTHNVFDPSPNTCNVGTNFKTGVSIEHENSAFFIVMPPKSSYQGINKSFGIFSDGINSVIQALARPRKKASIFIIMPSSEGVIKNPDSLEDYSPFTNSIAEVNTYKSLSYHNLNSQSQLLSEFHQQTTLNIQKGIENYHSRFPATRALTRPNLESTSLNSFILEDGERFLYSKFEIFGADLSAYVIWAAFNNQFLNCKLRGVYGNEKVVFTEGELQKGLSTFYYENFGYYFPWFLYSDLDFYNLFRNKLFAHPVFIGDRKVNSYGNAKLERAIIAFVQLRKKDNQDIRQLFNEDDDYDFNRDYILGCISISLRDDIPESISPAQKDVIAAYKQLGVLFQFISSNHIFSSGNDKQFLLRNSYYADRYPLPEDILRQTVEAIRKLHTHDVIIKESVVSFLQKISKFNLDSISDRAVRVSVTKAIYSEMRKLFFNTKIQRVSSPNLPFGSNNLPDNQQQVIIEVKELPNPYLIVNLLFTPQDLGLEESKATQASIEKGWLNEEEFYTNDNSNVESL